MADGFKTLICISHSGVLSSDSLIRWWSYFLECLLIQINHTKLIILYKWTSLLRHVKMNLKDSRESESEIGHPSFSTFTFGYACVAAKLDAPLPPSLCGAAGSGFGAERGQAAVVAPRSQQLSRQRGGNLSESNILGHPMGWQNRRLRDSDSGRPGVHKVQKVQNLAKKNQRSWLQSILHDLPAEHQTLIYSHHTRKHNSAYVHTHFL